MSTQVVLVKTSSEKILIFLQVGENIEVGKRVHYLIFNCSTILNELHSRS